MQIEVMVENKQVTVIRKILDPIGGTPEIANDARVPEVTLLMYKNVNDDRTFAYSAMEWGATSVRKVYE